MESRVDDEIREEARMAVFDLKQVPAEFTKAVNAGDLDALCDLYDADARFVPGGGAEAVSGAALREVLAGFLASRPVMEFDHNYLHVTGDIALARGAWKLTSKGADGSAQTIAGNSIEVLKKQADGSWRYLIDHPWGAD
jgi:uncharacterized protein (TIGR02246 family)